MKLFLRKDFIKKPQSIFAYTYSEAFSIVHIYFLLHCHALRQISWFIHLQSFGSAYVVALKLKRDHCQGCCKVRVCFRDVDGEVCGILDIVITKCGQAHKGGAAALTLNHIADCFFVEIRLGQHTDHKSPVFDQGDRSVFQLSGSIGFRVNVTDLFHLQTALQADSVINSSSYKESIFYICLF